MLITEENQVFSQEKAFSALFSGGQVICFQRATDEKKPTFIAYPFNSSPEQCQFFVLNPFKNSSKRNSDNVLYRQGFTIEQDSISLELQREWFKAVLGIPTGACFSGGKSIHNHIVFTKPLEEKEEAELLELLKKAFSFADFAVISNKAGLCRIPGAIRDNGKLQTIEQIGQRYEVESTTGKLKETTKDIGGVPEVANRFAKALADSKYSTQAEIIRGIERQDGKKKISFPSIQKALQNLIQNGYALSPETFEYRGLKEHALIASILDEEIEKAKIAIEQETSAQIATVKLPKLFKTDSWRKQTRDAMQGRAEEFYRAHGVERIKKDRYGYRGYYGGGHKTKRGGFSFLDTGAYCNFYSNEKGWYTDFLMKDSGIAKEQAWEALATWAGVEPIDKGQCKYCGEEIYWQDSVSYNEKDFIEPHKNTCAKPGRCKYCGEEIYWHDKTVYNDKKFQELHKPTCAKSGKCKYCGQSIYWHDKTAYNDKKFQELHKNTCTGKEWKKKAAKEEQERLAPLGFVERDGKTFLPKVDINPHTGEPEKVEYIEVANFTMRIEKKITDDSQIVSWLVRLQSVGDGLKVFNLAGEELVVVNKFREKIAQMGAYLYNITSIPEHNKFVDYVRNVSKGTREVRKTQYLGRVEPDRFLFNNAVYIKGQGTKPVGDYYQESKGAMSYSATDQADLKETVKLLERLYPGQSWKIWGFAVATFFFQSITTLLHFMPILFITGRKGTGKTRIAEFISGLFCAGRALRGFNFTSTMKAIFRTMQKYKACPVTLNEYSGKDYQNEFILESYDLEGYNRAKTDQSLDVNTGEINSSLIVLSTQNVSGKEAEAVASRVVTLSTDQATKDNDAFMDFRLLHDKMGAFIPHLLEHVDEANFMKWLKDMLSANYKKYDADSRTIETYTVLQCCANLFFTTLDFDEMVISDLGVCLQDQQEAVNSHDYAKVFLTTLETLVRQGKEIPNTYAKLDPQNIGEESTEEQYLLFTAVDKVYPLVKKFCIQAQVILPDKRTIIKLLRQAGVELKQSKKLGKNQFTWFYKLSGCEGEQNIDK